MINFLEIIIKFFQYILNPILKQFNILLIQDFYYHFNNKTFESNKIHFEIKFIKMEKSNEKYRKVISEKIIYKKQL